MLKKLNSLLFIAELLFIGVPITFVALLGGLFTVPMFFGVIHSDAFPTAIAVVVAYVGLFGFWGMALAFLCGGAASVRKTSAALRVPATIGVLMTLSFVAHDSFPQAKAFFVFAMFGIPLLIPVTHILLGVMASTLVRKSGEAQHVQTKAT